MKSHQILSNKRQKVDTQIVHSALVAVSVHPSAALRSGKSLTNFKYASKVVAGYLAKKAKVDRCHENE